VEKGPSLFKEEYRYENFSFNINDEFLGHSTFGAASLEQKALDVALTDAARAVDMAQIEALLGQGADVNGLDARNCYTPIIHAIQCNTTEAVARLLIVEGVNLSYLYYGNKNTALFFAIAYDRRDAFDLLIAHEGLDINQNDGGYEGTAQIKMTLSLLEQ
jgi:ankyrin repeat protein